MRTLEEIDQTDAARQLDTNESRQLASAAKWSRKAGAAFNTLQKKLARKARGGGRRRTVQIDPLSLAQDLGWGGNHG